MPPPITSNTIGPVDIPWAGPAEPDNLNGPRPDTLSAGNPHASEGHAGMTHEAGLRQHMPTDRDGLGPRNRAEYALDPGSQFKGPMFEKNNNGDFVVTPGYFREQFGGLTGLPSLGGKPIEATIEANIKEAQGMSSEEFLAAVVDPEKWDFKNNEDLHDDLKAAGANIGMEDFGNFHAGVLFAARGHDLSSGLSAAGAAQLADQDGGSWLQFLASPIPFVNLDDAARDYTWKGGTWGDTSNNGKGNIDSRQVMNGYDYFFENHADVIPPASVATAFSDWVRGAANLLPDTPKPTTPDNDTQPIGDISGIYNGEGHAPEVDETQQPASDSDIGPIQDVHRPMLKPELNPESEPAFGPHQPALKPDVYGPPAPEKTKGPRDIKADGPGTPSLEQNSGLWQSFKNDATNFGSGIKNTFSDAWSGASSAFSNAWSSTSNAFSNAWNSVSSTVGSWFGGSDW